jgi:3-methyladenine DNA glycosylase/8-oxoguanine DNA glycosylase
MIFEDRPKGPFDLAHQNQYFGGWPALQSQPGTIVMAFPVEGWEGSAAVALRQTMDGQIAGRAYSAAATAEKARTQALACLSLDVDAENWPAVSGRDAVIGRLQETYRFLRPILFHSPYEAAAGFIIGHRISIKQKQALVAKLAQDLGQAVDVEGQTFYAFPEPQTLLKLTTYKGLSEQKIERLHGVALAALDGLLDRNKLRLLPIETALTQLQSIPGVGPFFAQGILHRGAGVVDEVTSDDLTQYAVQKAYQLNELPDHEQLQAISQAWRPYRMWATVLLHVWLRREVGLPPRRAYTKK